MKYKPHKEDVTIGKCRWIDENGKVEQVVGDDQAELPILRAEILQGSSSNEGYKSVFGKGRLKVELRKETHKLYSHFKN